MRLSICCHYQDNLSASKIITKTTKTKQVKHLLKKINLAQQYYADKLYVIIQTPTEDMLADSLTEPKALTLTIMLPLKPIVWVSMSCLSS